MHECVLTAGVYFDLFDVLKNKDCQFSCTDANMSMDSGGWHFFGNPVGHRIPTGCGGGGWVGRGIANKVWHCFPCKTPRKHWHLTCFEIKKSCRFKVTFFFLSLYVFPVFTFFAALLTQFLATSGPALWILDILSSALFCHDSYSGHAVHLPKILPVSPAATALSFLFSSAPSPSFPPFSSARHSKRSLGFLSLHLSHYTPVFQSRLNWERLTRAHKELALRPREMKLNLLQVTLGENKQQM